MKHYARAGGDRLVIDEVAALLFERWDAAREFEAPDGSHEPHAHAVTVLGILATGPDTARVAGYLRRAEESALGTPRTTPEERRVLSHAALELLKRGAERAAAHDRG